MWPRADSFAGVSRRAASDSLAWPARTHAQRPPAGPDGRLPQRAPTCVWRPSLSRVLPARRVAPPSARDVARVCSCWAEETWRYRARSSSQTQADEMEGECGDLGKGRGKRSAVGDKRRHSATSWRAANTYGSVLTSDARNPRLVITPRAGKHKRAWRSSPPGGLVFSNARVVTRAALHAPTSRV